MKRVVAVRVAGADKSALDIVVTTVYIRKNIQRITTLGDVKLPLSRFVKVAERTKKGLLEVSKWKS